MSKRRHGDREARGENGSMDELEYLLYAALPKVGARYLWMPHAEHARETITVTAVVWNGEEFWVHSESEDSGTSHPNELDRWIEATVFLSPAPGPSE